LTQDIITLQVSPRTVVGKKVKQIRNDGWVPLVLYGPEFEPKIYQAAISETNDVLKMSGLTSLITLQIEGQKKSERALVRDVQRDVLTDELVHVDLYRVSMTQKISTEIPIKHVGESPLVVQGEAMLLTIMDRIEIECLADDLLSSLEIDLSALEDMDDVLLVKDLQVPEGVTLMAEEDDVVARLTYAFREEEEEEEEEALLEVASDEVEVISKGKEEEGEEEA